MSNRRLLPSSKPNPCPVCGNTNGNCRHNHDSGLVLCHYNPDSDPQHPDYAYKGRAKDGRTGIFVPRSDQDIDPLEFDRRKREWEAERRQALAGLMPEWQRDRQIREILSRLTLTEGDRLRLNAKGLPDDLIDSVGYRSLTQQWQPLGDRHDLTFGIGKGGNLKNHTYGILCPLKDAAGRFIGFKVWNFDCEINGEGKYLWLGKGSHQLPNGELPLAVYGGKAGETVGITEGLEIKPAIASARLGLPVIGFNGSSFDSSPQTLKATLESLGAKRVIFYPDAGAVINPNLPARYLAAAEMIQDLGIEVSFAWWDQVEKVKGNDIDEISPETLAAIAYISLEEFREKCPSAKPNAFQKWLGNAIDRLTSRRKSAPPKIEAEAIKGDRLEGWLEEGDFDILDRSFMGSGKSYAVPLVVNPEGKIWYFANDHRNPAIASIAQHFEDLYPRSDHFWQWKDGQLIRAEIGEKGAFKKGYCPSASLFPKLSKLGYNPNQSGPEGEENSICKACPYASQCKASEGWYRHDRRQSLSHSKIRAAIQSFPRDYDPSRDIAIIEEAGQILQPIQTLTATFAELLAASWQQKERLSPELWQELEAILAAIQPLFNNKERHGLTHPNIVDKAIASPELVAAINQDLSILNADSLPAEKLNKGLQSLAAEEMIKQEIESLPPAILSPFLQALAGEKGVCLRINGGRLIATIDRRSEFDFLGKFKRVIFLDATADPATLAMFTGRPIKVIANALPEMKIKIRQIQTEGLGSNDLSQKAIERVRSILRAVAADHPDLPTIGPKGIIEKLDLDGWWFRHSRGSNAFEGAEAMAFIGLPRPNIGAVQDEWQAMTGSIEGADRYYASKQRSEIVQGILGRQRASRYPDRQFEVIILTGTGLNDDLSFLAEFGAEISISSAFEISHEAGSASQMARLRLLQGIAEGHSSQAAIAKSLGISQQAISKLLSKAGVTISELQRHIEDLTTRPIKTLYRGGCGITELISAFRWFLDLPPAAVVEEVLTAIANGSLSEWLREFPAFAQARILGILYPLLLPNHDPPPLPSL